MSEQCLQEVHHLGTFYRALIEPEVETIEGDPGDRRERTRRKRRIASSFRSRARTTGRRHVHGELPNWPEWSAFDVLILLPECATALFYSFI